MIRLGMVVVRKEAKMRLSERLFDGPWNVHELILCSSALVPSTLRRPVLVGMWALEHCSCFGRRARTTKSLDMDYCQAARSISAVTCETAAMELYLLPNRGSLRRIPQNSEAS